MFVVVLAGSDPSGGAGLQLDLRVLATLNVEATAIPTLWTLQGSAGLSRIEVISPEWFRDGLETVFAELPVQVVKIGALGSVANVSLVANILNRYPDVRSVCDPVGMPSRSLTAEQRLLSEEGFEQLREELLPRVSLLTPNRNEAQLLSGCSIEDQSGMQAAAEHLLDIGARAVLLKGGHVPSSSGECVDLFVSREGESTWLEHERLPNGTDVRGTGCALSSAISAGLAQGKSLLQAVEFAEHRFQKWLRTSRNGRLGLHG